MIHRFPLAYHPDFYYSIEDDLKWHLIAVSFSRFRPIIGKGRFYMDNCCKFSRRNPLHCIIPPYVLENIAESGTDEQRTWAERTLDVSEDMRDQRQAIAKGDVPMPYSTDAVPGKNRRVYSADYGSVLPGRLVRQEGDPICGDAAVDEAYEGAGLTYDLFMNAYQRDSIDGRGMDILSTVHFQKSYDNAFWNGRQMVYGDGDEDLPPNLRIFNRFTISLDVIGHELTHGVTQYEANLVYQRQSGAVNESMSDVFGSLVKQQRLRQDARSADWIIGEGLFTANVNGIGLRSMKAPGTAYNDPLLGKDPQPGHMRDYVNTTGDNGGVHINSGIPNRAFYVAAYELGGFAWEKAGRIWYVTLSQKLNSTSDFAATAAATYQAAGELYGSNSLEQQAVFNGWKEVGIDLVTGETGTGCPLGTVLNIFRPAGRR
jgi:Zn-dependent metalloprotease